MKNQFILRKGIQLQITVCKENNQGGILDNKLGTKLKEGFLSKKLKENEFHEAGN